MSPSPAATVVVVGLGPAGPELVPPAAIAALASVPADARFLRTVRHPAAVVAEEARALDRFYEQADDLDSVYSGIVDHLTEAAHRLGRAVYAVPGSPLVAERTVELLRTRDGLSVEVVPALSFLDLIWARLGVDPLAAGVRLVDGHRFATEAAGERGPLVVAQCDDRYVLSAIKLAVAEPPDDPVVVLQRLGSPDESQSTVLWEDLDRDIDPDHLTTLWVPSLASPVARELERFRETVRRLRDECPWDREQTHQSLARYMLEEAREAVEAIEALDVERADTIDDLRDELGDVLLQVFLHARLAEQAGWFDLSDVAAAVDEKMVARHPHVFGDVKLDSPEEVMANWERLKQLERAMRRGDSDG